MPRKLTTEQFIEKARKVHGNKYDYSKVKYINNKTKVCIICHEHGEFYQTPHRHLKGRGCPECGKKIKSRLTTEQFILRAREIHGWKYDYSKVDFKTTNDKVCIICPKHGEFWQTPLVHIYNHGCGCKECRKENLHEKFKFNKEQFIEKARKVHGDKYDYSKIEYINSHTKVCIICPEHGEFWQMPYSHLNGKGCFICKKSKLETEVYNFLTENNIKFEQEKKFEWLKNKCNLRLDFYLPEFNIAIECQGEQHFIEEAWGKSKEENKEKFAIIKQRDKIKKTLCNENGIKLIYYFHNNYFLDKEIYNKENVIKDLNDLCL